MYHIAHAGPHSSFDYHTPCAARLHVLTASNFLTEPASSGGSLLSRVSPPTNKAQLHYSPPKAKPKIFTAQPPPTQLKFTTHNFQKKSPAPQVFSHLYHNRDILFGQELLKPSSLPPPYCHSSLAKTWYNLPKTGEKSRGTAIYVSDRIAPFCTPIKHVDREGLMTLLLLSLPGSPPTLLISLYCPPHDTRLRQIISEALDVLLPKYPSHIIGGDFNTSINFSLDTENITSSNAWPWLSNKVNKQPPALHDTFRDKHPHLKKCSRYRSTNHQNQARLDYIFASPQFTSTHPILDADIETSKFFFRPPPSVHYMFSTSHTLTCYTVTTSTYFSAAQPR